MNLSMQLNRVVISRNNNGDDHALSGSSKEAAEKIGQLVYQGQAV